MTPLTACLLVASLLFAVGLAGAITRRSAILVLAGIELMLSAANLNFIAFWRYGSHAASADHSLTGVLFVLFSIAVAAAEAAVGLALIVAIYRHTRTSDVTEITELKG